MKFLPKKILLGVLTLKTIAINCQDRPLLRKMPNTVAISEKLSRIFSRIDPTQNFSIITDCTLPKGLRVDIQAKTVKMSEQLITDFNKNRLKTTLEFEAFKAYELDRHSDDPFQHITYEASQAPCMLGCSLIGFLTTMASGLIFASHALATYNSPDPNQQEAAMKSAGSALLCLPFSLFFGLKAAQSYGINFHPTRKGFIEQEAVKAAFQHLSDEELNELEEKLFLLKNMTLKMRAADEIESRLEKETV